MSDGKLANGAGAPEIPEECIAGVAIKEGSNLRIEVQKVPVPKIGQSLTSHVPKQPFFF